MPRHSVSSANRQAVDQIVARVGAQFSLDPSDNPMVRAAVQRELARSPAGTARTGDDDDLALDLAVAKMRPTASMHVTEPRTYSRARDGRGNGRGVAFFRDVLAAREDPEARDRLMRHQAEEADGPRGPYLQRASAGMGNLAGLVVPAYITSSEMYAHAIATGRPFAEIMNRHPLPPEGATVNWPQGSAGTSAAIQTENAAASSQTMTGALGTSNVQTAAGTIQLSRQAVDRGTAIDEIVIADLLLRTASALDSQLINQASIGLNALANVSTFTSASPTGALLLTAIMTAAAGVAKSMQALGTPDACLMTEQRWLWLNSSLGTSLPLIQSPAPALPWAGSVEQPQLTYGKGPRGALPSGMPVFCDQNLPVTLGGSSNQDRCYVLSRRNMHIWLAPDGEPTDVTGSLGPNSGPLMYVSASQTQAASLSVVLSCWQYFAAAMNVYSGAIYASDGTGQVVQAGF